MFPLSDGARSLNQTRSAKCYGAQALVITYRSRLALNNSTDRKSTRLNSSHMSISYAVFCLKKKKKKNSALDNHAPTQAATSASSPIHSVLHIFISHLTLRVRHAPHVAALLCVCPVHS